MKTLKKGIITIIVTIAAALIFSTSIIPTSLVQAQNETQSPQPQTSQQSQGNQTGNNLSIQIAIYPSYKPCKDNPGVLCSIPPKPPKPIPPNMTILPPS